MLITGALRTRVATATAVATLAVLVVGCGDDGGDGASFDADDLSYEEILARPEVPPAEVPFRAILPTAVEQSLIDYALWLIRQPCVTAEGFNEPPRQRVATEEDRDTEGRRYYYIPLEQASMFGYSPPPGGAVSKAQDDYDAAFDTYVASLSVAEETRFGEVIESCLREAEGELCVDGNMVEGTGYCHRSLELAGGHDAVSFDSARSAPAVQEAERRWRSCLSEEGYDFDSVEDAWNAGGNMAKADAIDLAVADMTCKDEARLTRVWSTLEALIQEEMVERSPELFDGLPEQRAALLERAARIVADTSPP